MHERIVEWTKITIAGARGGGQDARREARGERQMQMREGERAREEGREEKETSSNVRDWTLLLRCILLLLLL